MFAVIASGQGNIDRAILEKSASENQGRAIIDSFSSTFKINFLSLIASEENLTRNAIAQPLAVASAVANWTLLSPHLPTPEFIAGYSVGELSAWGCSGALTIEQLVAMTYARCSLMEQHQPQQAGMLAIRGLGQETCQLQIKQLLGEARAYIAIVNEPDHFVIGGFKHDLRILQQYCENSSIWTKLLDVSVPSHTPLMQQAQLKFGEYLAQATFLPTPFIPVLSGISGSISTDIASGLNLLARAIGEPIDWQACMQTLVDRGIKVVLELGPGNALTKMFNAVHPQVAIRSVSDFRTIQGVVSWVGTTLSKF